MPLRTVLVRAAVGLGILLGILAAVLLIRAARLEAPEDSAPDPEALAIPEDSAELLARSLRFETVSGAGGTPDREAFEELHHFLAASFPRVHGSLELRRVGELSLLYRWRGADPDAPPLLLLAHQDVVPVDPADLPAWEHPPFSGRIAGGFVWGRGALDDKGSLMATLQAVEILLGDGITPGSTVYLAFGHDEESGGNEGAAQIASLLEEEGVEPLLVLDEGMAVVEGLLPGIEGRAALIGVAEKGFQSVELVARGRGGHSSMPPATTAAAAVAQAVARLDRSPMPAHLEGPLKLQLEALAPSMSFGPRLVVANSWLFGPLVKSMLAGSPSGNALLRTTTAPTMLAGSLKENVLPTRASAVVNFRIHPSDSIAEVFEHVERNVAGLGIEVEPYGGFGSEPSPVAPITGPTWDLLTTSVRQVVPETPLAPGLVVAATDSRHYSTLTDRVYRFVPYTLDAEDLERIHGIDERIRIEDYRRLIRFYAQLIRNAAVPGSE